MRLSAISFSLCVLLMAATFGATAQTAPSDTIRLWADGQVNNADEVVMYTYRPENPTGIGIVVCPGGSYWWHDEEGEGTRVGSWLQSNGITAYVLKYRVGGISAFIWHTRWLISGNRHPDMITDCQRALQWVWEHADEYSVDRAKIGMMGFSAGGHLVMSAACFSSTNFLEKAGVETDANLRPAFVAPIYPVVTMNGPHAHARSRRGLLATAQYNQAMRDSLSLERHIPNDCPPVFLINCMDDPVVDWQNSAMLDSALTANSVPHRYILYEYGKHGFGVSDYYGSKESRQWKNEFLDWLNGIIPFRQPEENN